MSAAFAAGSGGRDSGRGSITDPRDAVVGRDVRKFATSQMARTLATLLGGGMPLVNALDIAARSVGNQYMASELDMVTRGCAKVSRSRRR